MNRFWRNGFRTTVMVGALFVVFSFLWILGGCEDDDCVNCVELTAPVVPTGVSSVSGDNFVVVQWYDISYYPYDGDFNPNVVSYYVYSRYFEDGDVNDPDREFFLIGEVAWDENFDPGSGLHWFEDELAENGSRYEYAVTAVNTDGVESALSYEMVTDAPLPMGLGGVWIFGADGPDDASRTLSGFDFSDLASRPIDPWTIDSTYDIRVSFEGSVPFVETAGSWVRIQDFGMFVDDEDYLVFEGVSWAPADYYSRIGKLELILGHIYVVEIQDTELHYAKFGVVEQNDDAVCIVWAYQTINGLPELKAFPESKSKIEDLQISL
ncbi:MAG: hypothetical protein KOO60_11495 [Gemmatimonadales bacterium]|nr:hypothetical protein [Gemmatimonadales bacterium]